MNIITTLWNSQWTGILLWGVLTAIIFAPMLREWWSDRGHFDLFETKNIFRGVYFLYFGVPSFYYLVRPHQFPFVYDFTNSLKIVILLAIIGILSFYAGYVVRLKLFKPLTFFEVSWPHKRLIALVVVYTVIAMASFYILMNKVGGACYYFTHLGQTNVTLTGNIYWVWGILLIKSASLLLATYVISYKRKSKIAWIVLAIFLAVSMVVVTFIGARILLVVYLLELIILIHYLWRRISILILTIVGIFVIVVIVGVLGEFRNFSWSAPNVCAVPSVTPIVTTTGQKPTPTPTKGEVKNSDNDKTPTIVPTVTPKPSSQVDVAQYSQDFANQLGAVTSDKQLLLDRYIDNYFDSVRTTMMVIDNTPTILSYQYGLGYVQLLVHPVPRAYRPGLSINGQAFTEVFSEGAGYARVMSLLAEAYVNFWLFGIVAVLFVFGVLSRAAYDFVQRNRSNSWAVLVYAVIIGGVMMEIRGFFVGMSSLFLMDLLPVLLGMWWLSYNKKAK